MLKIVNTTVPKSNIFHGNYPITTFGVVFYLPSGLTVIGVTTPWQEVTTAWRQRHASKKRSPPSCRGGQIGGAPPTNTISVVAEKRQIGRAHV